ncbi:DUF4329 domain-containing protein [Chitinophaga sp. Cy-1792]|uniref:DUF4329 domain-containing protein n=1 Tax=Chitinophaga sp. Cy-1792 TaxID=2608339 RepID=UPI00141F8FEF|nr:DUF4329 domain-containing protein [Chitinophaga sp. Cy-1792]NIG54642.1 DUF4329 domain-containing protein [Chitinophaga sp. Cy-1792]
MDLLSDAAVLNAEKITSDASTGQVITLPEITVVADVPLKTKYPSLDDAAFGALAHIIDKSIKEMVEYAGWVYKNPNDSNFYFTPPRKGKADYSFAPKSDIPVTANLLAIGSYGCYHTHGGRPKGVVVQTDEEFSIGNIFTGEGGDKAKATYGKYFCYLGTPQGQIKKYTPIDLLPATQQSQNPTGLVETIGNF